MKPARFIYLRPANVGAKVNKIAIKLRKRQNMSIYKTDSDGNLTKFASNVEIVQPGTLRIDGMLFQTGDGNGGGSGGGIIFDDAEPYRQYFLSSSADGLDINQIAENTCVIELSNDCIVEGIRVTRTFKAGTTTSISAHILFENLSALEGQHLFGWSSAWTVS